MSQLLASPLDRVHLHRLLERFLEYVQIGTTAEPHSARSPSSAGQVELGKLLVEQLKQMGIENAHQDNHGLVWGLIPSNVSSPCATVMLNAHLDTSPEAPGHGVKPNVIEAYSGNDIPLGKSDAVIQVDQCPDLHQLIGSTLITTDGTTLLGADDKAGVAVIMELCAMLMENPDLPHGPVRVLFTCDEEIGKGTKHVDLKKIGARVGYTLDGGGSGKIDQETFSADLATVRFIGSNIHPSIAKGRMVNALRAAGMFLSELPASHLAPEVSDGREGFIHPYEIQGGVGEVILYLLLRDFETERLVEQASLLSRNALQVESLMPGVRVEVTTQRQYRNMRDGLKREPLSVDLAVRAFAALGITSEKSIVRGGTDGSLFTELGLPTPNLSCGQHNIHSVLEFACLEEMRMALAHLILLLDLWQQSSRH